jgi:hypothetical protein
VLDTGIRCTEQLDNVCLCNTRGMRVEEVLRMESVSRRGVRR